MLPGNSFFLDHLYALQCTECTVAWLGQIKYKRQITNLLQVFITVLADLICVRCIQKKIIGPGIFWQLRAFEAHCLETKHCKYTSPTNILVYSVKIIGRQILFSHIEQDQMA